MQANSHFTKIWRYLKMEEFKPKYKLGIFEIEVSKSKHKTKVGTTPHHSESRDYESMRKLIEIMEERLKRSETESINNIINNSKIKNHYEIKCGSKEDLLKVRKMIHKTLVGNPDYIDDKIILIDNVAYPYRYPENPGEYIIELFVFEDSTTDITDTMSIINLIT